MFLLEGHLPPASGVSHHSVQLMFGTKSCSHLPLHSSDKLTPALSRNDIHLACAPSPHIEALEVYGGRKRHKMQNALQFSDPNSCDYRKTFFFLPIPFPRHQLKCCPFPYPCLTTSKFILLPNPIKTLVVLHVRFISFVDIRQTQCHYRVLPNCYL